MKNLVGILLAFIVVVAFAACKKSGSSANPVVVSAHVNGVEWGASAYTVSFTKTPSLDVVIHAAAAGTALNFEFSPYTGRGTYTLGGSNNAYYLANNVYNHADSGQVVITDSYPDGDNHTIIKGNFSFTADNNITVTGGAFEVALNLN